LKGDRIFHINIVVRDLDRSLAFYTDVLGMKLIEPPWDNEGPGQSGIGLGAEGYGVNPATEVHVRFAFLQFGDNPNGALIDLLEFIRPRSIGGPPTTLFNVGIARIALKVDNVDDAHKELQSKGVKFVTPPVTVAIRPGVLNNVRYCCFYDPDGTILEIYSDGS
jgi:catechol 2,3-dioxygenase-like lactoylglutathione lyase family enzyme